MLRALMPSRSIAKSLALALGVGLLLAYAEPSGSATTSQFTIDVPDGKARGVRLRNLPRGTLVSVKIESTGRLRVALVSVEQLKAKKPEALFRGALDRSLSFQVMLPESTDYFLFLDNRRGTVPVKARTTIRAEKAPSES